MNEDRCNARCNNGTRCLNSIYKNGLCKIHYKNRLKEKKREMIIARVLINKIMGENKINNGK